MVAPTRCGAPACTGVDRRTRLGGGAGGRRRSGGRGVLGALGLRSAAIDLVLLDLAQDPVELACGELDAAVLAAAGHVDRERCGAARAGRR